MSLTRRNLLANFSGAMWVAALVLVLTPVYVRLLGIGAYGLVGFYTSMQAVLTLLDMGFGMTLNRELARLAANGASSDRRSLVQTLETIYWAAAAAIAALLCALAPLIASRWIHSQTLPTDLVRNVVMLMGIAIGFNFPTSLYSGGLLGLQRHVRLNAILATFGTLRWGGAAVVLTLRPSVLVFFAWQASVVALQTITLAIVLSRAIGATLWRRRFRMESLARLRSFATGLAMVTLLGALLTHADKLIVSRFTSLEVFGYYSLAATIASGLALMAMPFFATVFPQLSALSVVDEEGMRRLYHRVSQGLAAFLLPTAAVLSLFAREVLLAWTHEPTVAEHAAPFLSVLAIGFGLHGLAYMPYALQLANGWVSLLLRFNAIALVVLIPFSVASVLRVGPLGPAVAWALLNAGYVVIGVLIMHKRLLQGEQWTWYAIDLGKPLLGTLLIAIPARFFFPSFAAVSPTLVLAIVAAATLSSSLLFTPAARSYFRRRNEAMRV